MKSWFSRPPRSPSGDNKPERSLEDLLGQAEGLLRSLQHETEPSFPQLNAATRVIQQLDVRVRQMHDGSEMSAVWGRWVPEAGAGRQQAGGGSGACLASCLQVGLLHLLAAAKWRSFSESCRQ